MATKRLVTIALCWAAVLVLGGARDASGHHTYFTFTHPVEIPGNVTLPPGIYEFRTIQTTTNGMRRIDTRAHAGIETERRQARP